MSLLTDSLQRFEALQSTDEVKTDLELTCTECGEVVCDIEHGDNLKVLAEVADEHECSGEIEDDDLGLSPFQRGRYEALEPHVGHDAALRDARSWPKKPEN